ncbi:MAG: ATP-dependent zinc metalloprotease FtsH [Myxococcales bacterium]|nr:ATP-dependent zinc metalloprotease FtsH [Myxococcales bacterium]
MQLNPGGAQQIAYYDFKNRLRAGQVDEVLISDDTLRGRWRNAPAASPGPAPTSAPSPAARPAATPPRPTRPWRYDFETVMLRDEQLLPLLEAQHVRYAATVHPRWPAQVLLFGAVLLFFLLMGRSLLRRLQGQAGGVFAFGRSKGKMVGEGDVTVRFEDVAGVDEAKEELQEVVEFLKSPEKFIRIGARIPKGVLLVGPPGTGKTLLARAVAGEAHVAFFSLSGSEFVEMFVGVGAARVRDLFENAKQSAPCIVFIDELDALGRSRGSNVSNANEEREQTLNQLLVEMDGFESNKGVILLAATNRPEILDRALLRPGRFDRQVLVDRPDRKGRAQILRVHARKVQLAPEVDLDDLAARTPGFAGADLANIINEGALLAARRDKPAVTRAELEEAIERVSAGLERKSRIISPVERRRVAYHEIGHALVGALLPGGSEVTKISIVPRGVGALGYTMKLPTEDRYLMTEAELSAQLAGLLGGRVAEQIVFGDLSTGASNDLQRATELARAMVSEYGMSRAIGPVGLGQERSAFLPTEGLGRLREHGDQLADLVDHEVKRIVESAELEAKMLLTRHRDALEALAQALLEREYLDAASFRGLLDASVGPRPEGPTTVSASRV